MKKMICIIIVIFLSGVFTNAYSAIMVVSAKGDASYQAGGKWKPMTKGLVLAEGTKICTGVNSSAVLDIDQNIVTIKPMTSIKIYKNSLTSTSSDNSIGLQYGAVQAKVKKTAAVKTRFNITTPVATSSVRGTEEAVSFGPVAGMKVEVIEGSIRAHNDNGVSSAISGREKFKMREKTSRPESLVADIKDGATVNVTPDNITDEERDALNNSGDDALFDSGTGAVQKISAPKIKIFWP